MRVVSTTVMAGRRKIQPGRGDPYDPLTVIISDAVESAANAANEVGPNIRQVVYGRSGLGAVFSAAMDAVADTKPKNINPRVFDAAMKAAAGAVAGSAVPSSYYRVRLLVESIPDRLVRMAGRVAAANLFAKMSVRNRSEDGRRLLDRMRTSALQAVKTRLERDDAASTVRAASADIRNLANIVHEDISETVLHVASVHAATVAVFEVAIRGATPRGLADAIKDACNDLSNKAVRYDYMTNAAVAAIAALIAGGTAGQRRCQTVVREADKISRSEAADRIVEDLDENVFQTVYMALVSSAYAHSDRSVFKFGYGKILMAACGVELDPKRPARMGKMGHFGSSRGVNGDGPLEQYHLQDIIELLLNNKGDTVLVRRFISATDVDYKSAVSSGHMDGIISLYGMAYRAGYEGARAVCDEQINGAHRQQR